MKQEIENLIHDFIANYQEKDDIKSSWKEPIIKYAAADDPMFGELKKAVSEDHLMPEDLMPGARTIIAYFIPFSKGIADSNIEGKYSSDQWAKAYIETNQLIADLNQHLKEKLSKKGYQASLIAATNNFDKERLISDWSHRHAAYIAGLGTFGLNNMLITEKGCAGRIGTLVTDLNIEASERSEQDKCLNKAGFNCSKCVDRCVNGSLQEDSFDRHQCYQLLSENDKIHPESELTDVCGKCSVDLPCSFSSPV
ncbi:epoxyqueuosine reductase [Halanaerobium sp. ST460_2HS_T2]|uniref:epoxyqueuosine reductase n=1 Tax=Halanaerobium sp. ST460_2HS_T2 TaxID=2183914 RepID=UPI000DF33E4F|nr:epoxyqueuosine reductase [Halanaerobium sp. ST460_2HS_T2]RCW58697.1 epoxyqueuosine reductase QueG [Halanaerobium sp. ST460_2HS_T2]